jgi:large-conductance mechanosensitive channel
MKSIIKTLLWRDLLIYALSVYIGTVMYNFFDSFVKYVFLPLIHRVFPSDLLETSSENLNFHLFLSESINLTIACFLTFYSIKIIQKLT